MIQVLNGPIEMALRVIALLDAYEDVPLSREQLILLDHALIHSADYDGPPSLHPPLPARESELSVKRSQVNAALQLLVRAGLADIQSRGPEVGVRAADGARPFLQLLETPYARRCGELARWTREVFGEASVIDLDRRIGLLAARSVPNRRDAENRDSTTED
ncbi:threonine transporter [Aeromicrobium senzhongii]|uniref:Threonine transporter n=1 Tax=Aeromicrobium senzhongii TaxID=2663859 RepID=A0ABX6T2N4_9ACTN|nr:ABC-three component system middle component 2 [Aeromicrobium senzhongii]MTB87210.1 threonine transporter [Aeromicrobium senzhongii]QNL95715.1 threonine transporter [Aeromicrobium senzhongii]